jgi:hypothetical protein
LFSLSLKIGVDCQASAADVNIAIAAYARLDVRFDFHSCIYFP